MEYRFSCVLLFNNLIAKVAFPRIFLRQHWIILTGAFVAALISIYIIHAFPVQYASSDEVKNIVYAHRDGTFVAKLSRLIPGNMVFDWAPPFSYSFYGLFADNEHTRDFRLARKTDLGKTWGQDISAHFKRNWTQDFAAFFLKLAWLNIALFIISGINIYWICHLLKLGKTAAIIAAFVFFFNPRIFFYVPGLWQEFLHLAMFTTALLLLILCFYRPQRQKIVLAIFSGILFGFCSLTKGVTGFFMMCLLPVLAYFFYLHYRKNIKLALAVIAVFYGGYFSIILPQKLVNYIEHQAFAISTNYWVNIELGLTPYEVAGGSIFKKYFQSSPDLQTREALSRQRVLDYLQQQNLLQIVYKQARQFIHQQLNNSQLASGFQRKKWLGLTASRAVENLLLKVSVILSWLAFLFGLVGIILYRFKSFGGTVLTVYILYYLASLLIVGFNPRFFIQVLPFLGIFATFPFWHDLFPKHSKN